jgi:hypothetical protein
MGLLSKYYYYMNLGIKYPTHELLGDTFKPQQTSTIQVLVICSFYSRHVEIYLCGPLVFSMAHGLHHEQYSCIQAGPASYYIRFIEIRVKQSEAIIHTKKYY